MRKLAQLILLLIFASPVVANSSINPPQGPSYSADGTYTITFQPMQVGYFCEQDLQEYSSASSGWMNVNHANGVAFFQSKPVGQYRYRVRIECEHPYSEGVTETISSSISLQVGPTPEFDSVYKQMYYEYEVRFDGVNKVFVRRLTSADDGNGTIRTLILQSTAAGMLTRAPTAAEESQALNWQLVSVDVLVDDVNLDGFVDLAIEGIGDLISGAEDQLVFAPGELYATSPSSVVAMDQEFRSFASDMANYLVNPNYFDDNAVEIETPGYWRTVYECDSFSWGDSFEVNCYSYEEWVDGVEIVTYPGINPDAVGIWEALSQGSNDVVKDILESIFGVGIGGGQWCIDFGFVAGSSDCDGILFNFVWLSLVDTEADPKPSCSATPYTGVPDTDISLVDQMDNLVREINVHGSVRFRAAYKTITVSQIVQGTAANTVKWGLIDIGRYNMVGLHVGNPVGSIIPWQFLQVDWCVYGAPKRANKQVFYSFMNDAVPEED